MKTAAICLLLACVLLVADNIDVHARNAALLKQASAQAIRYGSLESATRRLETSCNDVAADYYRILAGVGVQ